MTEGCRRIESDANCGQSLARPPFVRRYGLIILYGIWCGCGGPKVSSRTPPEEREFPTSMAAALCNGTTTQQATIVVGESKAVCLVTPAGQAAFFDVTTAVVSNHAAVSVLKPLDEEPLKTGSLYKIIVAVRPDANIVSPVAVTLSATTRGHMLSAPIHVVPGNDDPIQDNNSRATAKLIVPGVFGDPNRLQVGRTIPDWYRFGAGDDETISVVMAYDTAGSTVDIDLYLYDQNAVDPNTPIAMSTLLSGREEVRFRPTAASTFFLEVRMIEPQDQVGTYQFSFGLISAVTGCDDQDYEFFDSENRNNERDFAILLTESEQTAPNQWSITPHICPGDVDWLGFDATLGQNYQVSISWESAVAADLNLMVCPATQLDETLCAKSIGFQLSNPHETILITPATSSAYAIRVFPLENQVVAVTPEGVDYQLTITPIEEGG